MEVSIFEEFFANCLTYAAFKEHIVGQHHGGTAGGLEHRADMLEEIELLVGACRPKVLPVVHEIILLLLTLLVGEGHAALFAKRGIGQHIVKPPATVGDERVIGRDKALAIDLADVVQEHVHQAETSCIGDDLVSEKGFMLQKGFLSLVQRMVGNEVIVGC